MADGFIKKYDPVILVDPDPLAGIIFRKLHKSNKNIIQKNIDLFSQDSDPARKFLDDFKGYGVLFSNILGQIVFIKNCNCGQQNIKKSLSVITKNRAWLSFHDRLSGFVKPRIQGTNNVKGELPSNKDLLNRFYTGEEYANRELNDHETEHLFQLCKERYYFTWQISPGYYHLIEGCSNDGSS